MGQLISLTQAQRIRRRLREQGQNVVLTNGVFDLLHVGHIRYLEGARRLGDVLFVALNSDASARQLKGPGRPWVAETERAEVLCALTSVDYVVLFDELTAERVVAALRPEVYVKGGDYAATDGDKSKALPEAPTVASYGGRVVILPYTPGRSTTQLAALIRGGGELDRVS